MNLFFAVTIGALFGTGVFLLLKPDLFRVVVGLVLVSNAANLTLMASGLTRGEAPIAPGGAGDAIADPLVQALTLTALVIGFAVTALLMAFAYGVYRVRRSVDLDELSREEMRAAEAAEAAELAHDEEGEPEARVHQRCEHDEVVP